MTTAAKTCPCGVPLPAGRSKYHSDTCANRYRQRRSRQRREPLYGDLIDSLGLERTGETLLALWWAFCFDDVDDALTRWASRP